jgi:antirestriction protein ArdC
MTTATRSRSAAKSAPVKHDAPAQWADLLVDAVNTPGTISAAYSAFHNYSVGNQLLALFQCKARDITPGPIATFKGWQTKNRMVNKGEKAIVLCQPISFARKETDEKTGEETERRGVFFKYSPRWFVVAQTSGQDAEPPVLPEWDLSRALAALDIARVPFTMIDGNTQGYALKRQLALNPVGQHPLATAAHELAHIMLGHTGDEPDTAAHAANMPRSLKEVEAEAVALIVLESLGQDSAESRGYIQHWLRGIQTVDGWVGPAIPEASASRIFSVADKILKAGRPVKAEQDTDAE